MTGLRNKSYANMMDVMQHVYVDTSQSHGRRCFTSDSGNTNCLTTSTQLYSFGRDSLVLAKELMFLQGHKRDIVIPSGMSDAKLADLAGEGICLPCLASVLWALYLVKEFP
jgi:hypothetical protein